MMCVVVCVCTFLVCVSSLCSGSGGHLHSGMAHWHYVCCGFDRSHPPGRLLHQEEPRGEISRYGADLSYFRRSHPVANNNVLIPVREKKDVTLEPVDDIDQEGSFDYK